MLVSSMEVNRVCRVPTRSDRVPQGKSTLVTLIPDRPSEEKVKCIRTRDTAYVGQHNNTRAGVPVDSHFTTQQLHF